MTREETKRVIEIMQAFVDGKEIEYKGALCDWESTDSPYWNWDSINYRIKSQPQYKPYDDVLEIQKDKWIAFKKDKDTLFPIKSLEKKPKYVLVYDTWLSLKDFYENCEYEDGTPCGKVVSE